MSKKKTESTITDSKSFNIEDIAYWKLYLLIFLATFAFYGWTYSFDLSFDDGYITDILSGIQKNGGSLKAILSRQFGNDYRPISIITFWIQYSLTNEFSPGLAHIINVFLFGCVLILIFKFIMLSSFYSNKDTLFVFALLVIIIFLIHPMHISVVVNIKNRDNLLSMLFGLLCAIQIIQYFKDKRKWRIGLFLFFLLIGNLSKADAYSFSIFPLLYFVIYYFEKIKIKNIVLLIILFIVAINFTDSIKWETFKYFTNQTIIFGEQLDNPLFYGKDTFINRLSMSLTTLWYYFKFFILPFGHYVYYGYNQIPLTSLFSFTNILSFSIHLFILAFSIKKFKTQRIYLFSYLFYLLAIFYASNFMILVSGILADRYNFIGSLGMTFFAVALFVEYNKTKDWHLLLNKYFLIFVIVYSVFNFNRTADWKNRETLFLHDIKKIPNSAHLYQMLNSIYLNAALFDKIPRELANKKMDTAIYYIDKGLSISEYNQFLFENKGISLLYYDKIDEALPYFKKSAQLDSSHVSAFNYIGVCFRNKSEIDSALYYFGISMNRDNMFGYGANNYIDMLVKTQQNTKIDSTLNKLLQRFPNDTYLKKKIKHLVEDKVWYDF